MLPFSVILPCYNPNPQQLRRALRSICTQLVTKHNQIVVLDDGSTTPTTRIVAEEFPGVQYLRNSPERGGIDTHNQAFALAEHEYVHILHPDDFLLQGFYGSVGHAIAKTPGRALYAARFLECESDGTPMYSGFTPWLFGEAGRQFLAMHHGNPLAVAGCVLRTEFVREYGGWDKRLIHCADWEMWIRATTLGGAVAIEWPLACYLNGDENHTSRIRRTADNLRDYLTCADVVSEYASVDRERFREYVRLRGKHQAAWFRERGENEPAEANEKFCAELEGK